MEDRITAWRITQKRYVGSAAANAFSGEGARRYGGRWNSRGTPVAYTAATRSLALLELLVHVESAGVLARYVLVPVTFEADRVEALPDSELPADWRVHPAPTSTQQLGDQWVREMQSPILRVPSVILPMESNFVVNVEHPDFGELEVGVVEAIDADRRLFNLQ